MVVGKPSVGYLNRHADARTSESTVGFGSRTRWHPLISFANDVFHESGPRNKEQRMRDVKSRYARRSV